MLPKLKPHYVKNFDARKMKVMIVDDHDPIRKAMARVLAKMGIGHIIQCFDGEDAIKYLKTHTVDLILCDLFMRKIDGYKVISFIRNMPYCADIPIIVVTGETEKENIIKANDLGADDYILKPFQVESIESKTITALNNYYSPSPLLKAIRYGDRLMGVSELVVAQKTYRLALEIDHNSMRAKHSLAYSFYKNKQYDDAIKILQQNIVDSNSYYRNYQTLANVYLELSNEDKAIEYMTMELALHPNQSERQIQLSKLLLKKKNHEEAIVHLRIALKETPKDKVALFEMGNAFALAEDVEKALYYYRRLQRTHPEDPQALEAIISFVMNLGYRDKAEKILKEEISKYPSRKYPDVMLAKLYLRFNELNSTLEVVDQLLKKDPMNLEGLKIKAQLFMKEKKFQEAEELYQKILSEDKSYETYISLIRCQIPLGKMKTAVEFCSKALDLSPKDKFVYYLLSVAYKRSEQKYKAFFSLELAKKFGYKPAS